MSTPATSSVLSAEGSPEGAVVGSEASVGVGWACVGGIVAVAVGIAISGVMSSLAMPDAVGLGWMKKASTSMPTTMAPGMA
jgi:hypothetical protein